MYIQYLLCALREVWSLLWEVPAPCFMLAEEKLRQKMLIFYILVMFPLLGCLVWAGLSVLGAVAGLLPGQIAAGMLFAVLSVFFLEILGGGKGLSSCSSFLEKLLCRESFYRSVFTAENDIRVNRSPIGLICMFALLLLRGGCLALLYASDNGNWFALVFILSYALQAQLATLPLLSSGESIIKTDLLGIRVLWIAAVVLALICGRHFWGSSLVALALTALITWTMYTFFARKAGGITGALIGTAGYCLETILLLTGVGLLLR